MPLYEYECDACGHRFEVIQKFSDPPVEKCPACGSTVHKLQSAPAFQFKGTGWYVTDYAKSGAGSDSKSGKDGGKESGKEGGKDAKKAESATGSEKPSSAETGSSSASSSSSSSSAPATPAKSDTPKP
jgi:putative FmdB family regulatory protein